MLNYLQNFQDCGLLYIHCPVGSICPVDYDEHHACNRATVWSIYNVTHWDPYALVERNLLLVVAFSPVDHSDRRRCI